LSTKVVSWISLIVILVLAAVITLQVMEFKFYDGTFPQNAQNTSVWHPKP